MAGAGGEQSPDALLADLGGELASAVPPAVEAWVVEGAVPLRFTYENAAKLYEQL